MINFAFTFGLPIFIIIIIVAVVFLVLFGNREKWLRYRNKSFKKIMVDTPGDCKIFITTKVGEYITLKIMGEKRTFFCPRNASRDGIIFHFSLEDPNPITFVNDKDIQDKAVSPVILPKDGDYPKDKKDDKPHVLRIGKHFFTSARVTTLIANPAFTAYLKTKLSGKESLFIVGLIIVGLIGMYNAYITSQIQADFSSFKQAVESVISNGE